MEISTQVENLHIISPLVNFFMLNIAFDILLGTVFVKWIGILCFLQYKDYNNILLFVLCLDMLFFIKT